MNMLRLILVLLVLAVGALGAGAMVLNARRAAQQSSRLSAAVNLAALVADSMRANSIAMRSQDNANPYLQLDYDALADGPPGNGNDCSGAACDSAALAAADLRALRHAVHEHYPLGRIKICRDGSLWDPAALAIRWECSGASGAPVVIKIGWRARLTGANELAGGAAAGGAPVMVALPVVLNVPLAGPVPAAAGAL